jgi:diacylglycerol kinase family enzyme
MTLEGDAVDSQAVTVALGRRLAAVAAIVCLLGALLTVSLAVIRGDAWRLPVVILATAAGVMGLWYLASRRGAIRVIGAIVAAAGLVTWILVTVTADYRGVPFILAVALILVSASCAQYALRRDARTMRADQGRRRGQRPARRPVLLMNPRSGGGKAERFGLVDACRERGIEAVVLRPGDDLLELARDAIARGADAIGMAGGDGSQALVARVAAEHDIPHICVPAGTRNHFALDLGLDRDDVVGALDAFSDRVERRVDLAELNGRVFVNNASLGIYAKIVQSDAYRDEKLQTAAEMLPDMLGPDAEPFDLRFIGPDGEKRSTAHLILVSNNPYELDHLLGRGTRARMDLGTLGVVTAQIAGPADAVRFVGLEAAGRIRSFPGWLEWNAPTFRIDSGDPVEVGIDGEALLLDPPLLFRSVPGALRVWLPAHAPQVAPAASSVQLTASTVLDLFRTAAGRPS